MSSSSPSHNPSQQPVPSSSSNGTTAVMKGKKRRRTRSRHTSSPSPNGSRGFFVPGFDLASNNGDQHKMMTLEELMDTAKGVTNMILAHEIAVDKNFKLEDLKGESTKLEKEVKEIVHKAFWDLLEEELKRDPPSFDQAFSVLKEVKANILGLLTLPQHQRIKSEIMERFDLELIRQQAENGVLDFESYAQYVVGLMAKLCAPVRDDEIAQLRKIKDIVPLFKEIMRTLDNMKLDMANFTLHQAKPFIVAKSVEYEKEKFKEFLSKREDGLKATREWFQRHSPIEDITEPGSSTTQYKKLIINRVLIDSFTDLLEWDEYYDLPETLVMDQKRIWNMRDLCERTSVSTAVILSVFSNVSTHVIPVDAQKLKEKIKSDIDILLEDFCADEDLIGLLPKVGEQVVKILNDYLVLEKGKTPLNNDLVTYLKSDLNKMEDPNHRIRDLVQKRILEFCKQAISGSRSAPLQVPPGLTICQKQLGQIAGAFVQLVSYNRAVFNETYVELIENHVLFKSENGIHTENDRESRLTEA